MNLVKCAFSNSWKVYMYGNIADFQACMLHFLKAQGHQDIFSLVKGTLWGNCSFFMERFKGTKAMTRGHYNVTVGTHAVTWFRGCNSIDHQQTQYNHVYSPVQYHLKESHFLSDGGFGGVLYLLVEKIKQTNWVKIQHYGTDLTKQLTLELCIYIQQEGLAWSAGCVWQWQIQDWSSKNSKPKKGGTQSKRSVQNKVNL